MTKYEAVVRYWVGTDIEEVRVECDGFHIAPDNHAWTAYFINGMRDGKIYRQLSVARFITAEVLQLGE